MKTVAVVTDTIATISPQMTQEYEIEVVPLYVIVEGKQYLDTEFDSSQWGQLHLRRKDGSLTTSSPSPGDYLKVYQKLSRQAQSILCITFSPFMGMAYKSAMVAADIAKELLPEITIRVIDSHTVCASQLLLVLSAAKAATQGKSLGEIVHTVNEMIPRLNHLVLVPASGADFLAEGGRARDTTNGEQKSESIPQSIMEIGAATDGSMNILARVGSRAEGIEKLIGIVRDRNRGGRLHIAMNYNTDDTYKETEELKRRLLSQFQCVEVYVTQDALFPVIYEGPGGIKLGWYSDE